MDRKKEQKSPGTSTTTGTQRQAGSSASGPEEPLLVPGAAAPPVRPNPRDPCTREYLRKTMETKPQNFDPKPKLEAEAAGEKERHRHRHGHGKSK